MLLTDPVGLPTILPELMKISGARVPSGPPLPPAQLKAALCLHLGASDGLAAFNQLTAGPQDIGDGDRTMLTAMSAGTSTFPEFTSATQEAPVLSSTIPWLDGARHLLESSPGMNPAAIDAMLGYAAKSLPTPSQRMGSLGLGHSTDIPVSAGAVAAPAVQLVSRNSILAMGHVGQYL